MARGENTANHPGRKVDAASMRDKLVGQPGLGPLGPTDSWNFKGGAMAYYEPGKLSFHQSPAHPAQVFTQDSPAGGFSTIASKTAPAIGMAEGLKLQAAAHEHARVKKAKE